MELTTEILKVLDGQIFAVWFLIGAAAGSLVLTTAVCEIPFMAKAFEFTTVEPMEYAIAIGLAILMIPIVEIVKAIQRTSSK